MENRVAITTGGTKGIGYGAAEEHLKEGVEITICSRNTQEGVKAAKELGGLGEVLCLQANVSPIEGSQMLVNEAVEKYGRLDASVANAEIDNLDKTHYLHIMEEQYDRILGVSLKELFFEGQLAARQMVKQEQGGAVVNISSVDAYLALDSQVCCTTNKGGVSQLIKVQAMTLTSYDIKVDAIYPDPASHTYFRAHET